MNQNVLDRVKKDGIKHINGKNSLFSNLLINLTSEQLTL